MPQLFSNPVLKCFKSWKRGCLFAAFPCLIALAWFFHHTIYAKAGHPGMVYLPPHASARTLSEILHQRGLLKHPGVLRLYLRIWHLAGHLKPGYYAYTADENLSQLVQKMVTGKVYTVPLTIIEGSRLCELETIWSNSKTYRYQASLLNDFKPVHGSLEGLFFPSTYPQAYRESMLPVLKLSYQTLEHHLNTIWQHRAEHLPYHHPYELLIAASIIEKETADPNERFLIAAVIRNRLNKGMRLQMDPTVAYGLPGCAHHHLTGKDLKIDSPYNTYLHQGLPPTPIAMVSRLSLEAAAHPAKVDYLYFVAKGDGHHVFSTDYIHQQQAVNLYLRTKHGQ